MKATSLLTVVFAGVLVSVHAATDYRWSAVEGVFDDSFENTAHWIKKGTTEQATHVPGADGVEDENAVFHTSPMGTVTDGYTVTYPQGEFTNSAGLTFALERTAGVTLDGTGTHLVYPCPSDGYVKNNGFNVGMGSGSASGIFVYQFNGQKISRALFEFNDFRLTVTNSTDERRLEFVRGTFSFPASQYMHFFYDGTGTLPPPVVQVDKGADVTYYGTIAGFGMPSDSNLVRVDGGKLNLESTLQLPMTTFSCWFKETPQLLELLAVNGGELNVGQSNRSIGFGSTKSVGTASSTIRLLADHATLNLNYRAYTSSVGKGRHEIVLRNRSTGFLNGKVQLGNYASATGLVSIVDSTVATYSADGEWVLGGTTAADIAAGSWGELDIERSVVSLTNSIAVTAGRVKIVGSDVVLGAAAVKIYSRDSAGGTSALVTDGARVTLHPTATTEPFAGFSSATIGAKGLTIEAAKDVTISQSFADASDEAGVLTLAGAGKKTVTGDLTVSRVVVLGGDVEFTGTVTAEVVSTNGAVVSFASGSSAGNPLGGLILGSETAMGRLAVGPGEKIYLGEGASCELQNVRFVLNGSFEEGDCASLVAASGVSAEARTAWMKGLAQTGVLPEGKTWDVSEKTLPDGGTELVVSVVKDEPLVIEVPAETVDTHQTNVIFSSGRTLKTVVGHDAELHLDGTVGYGRLWQAGGGATYLTGQENGFLSGLLLEGGLLDFATPASLGSGLDAALQLNGGTLSIGGTGAVSGSVDIGVADKNTPMIFRTAGDVTLNLAQVERGKILKLGEGRLALEVEANKAFSQMGWGFSRPLAFDAANGSLVSGTSATLDVAEGTLALTSSAATPPVVTINNADIVLGGETGSAASGPVAFELNHVDLRATYNNNAPKLNMQPPPANMPNRTSASVVLRNGAALSIYQYSGGVNYSCSNTVDASTLKVDSTFNMSAAGGGVTLAGTNFWTVTNGGQVYAGNNTGVNVYGPAVYVLDRGTLAKNANGDPMYFSFVNPFANSRQQFFVCNKSYFAVSYFGAYGADQSGTYPSDTQRYELTFDDSEWFAGEGARALASSNMYVTVTTTGGGLRLNPKTGSTWTLYTPVDGDGGLYKGGEGTLIVDRAFRKHKYLDDPVTLAYGGRTTVTGGTLKVVSGACAHHTYGLGGGATLDLDGVEIADADVAAVGNGTLVNASVTGLTLRPQYADGTFSQVTFGANTSLAGRTVVDFGRTSADPLPTDIKDAVIARWTGTKPDAGRWRSANLGTDDYKMTFVANDDGTITGSCERKGGLMLIFR